MFRCSYNQIWRIFEVIKWGKTICWSHEEKVLTSLFISQKLLLFSTKQSAEHIKVDCSNTVNAELVIKNGQGEWSSVRSQDTFMMVWKSTLGILVSDSLIWALIPLVIRIVNQSDICYLNFLGSILSVDALYHTLDLIGHGHTYCLHYATYIIRMHSNSSLAHLLMKWSSS